MNWTHKVVNEENKYWWYARMSGTTLYLSGVYNRDGIEVYGPCSYSTFSEDLEELYDDMSPLIVYTLNKFKGNK